MNHLNSNLNRNSKQLLFSLSRTKLLLTLLIFTPLIYSSASYLKSTNLLFDIQALIVIGISILFLLIKIPRLFRLALWIQSGVAYVLAIAFIIAIQPVFLFDVDPFYNFKFLIVLLLCFLPTILLSNCHSSNALNGMAFIHRSLELLFKVCVVSLSVSAIFGLGEVYTQGGELQQRAFSWLGDSFSPVMIFFLYYYTFRKKKIEFLLSLACIVVIMQAKMAIIVAVLGYFFYLFLFSQPVKRLFLTAALAIILLTLPMLFEIAVNNIHNFEYSLNNRLFSFNASLHFFWSSPLFGVGINQTFKLLTNDFDVTSLELYVSDIKYYEILKIHNSFLRILSELGVFGFLFFAAFCIVIVRRSYFILISVQLLPLDNTRALLMACSLWLISFVLFYQTTGWFEPGHPQLAWLICFLTLMNFAYLSLFDSNTALSKRIRYT